LAKVLSRKSNAPVTFRRPPSVATKTWS